MPLPRASKYSQPLATPSPRAASATKSPTFYPPSYYAAANGMAYSGKAQRVHRDGKSTSTISHKPDATSNYEQFMPVSYLPEPSSSDSSWGLGSSKRDRSSGGRSAHTSKRERRQSQITGLPQIEAQLLPSLRDTIDRMTRPPPNIAASQSLPAKSLDHVSHGDVTQTRAHSAEPRAREKHHPSEFASNSHEIQSHRERVHINTHDDRISHSDATPKIKTRPLKSALRTPTPRSFQGQESLSSAPRTPTSSQGQKIPKPDVKTKANPTGSSSLRSVKRILARKLSTTSTISKESTIKPILKGLTQTPKLSQTQSVVQPPHPDNHLRANLENYGPIRPQTPLLIQDQSGSRATTPVTPHLTKQFASSIPRPRARFAIDYIKYQTSDSSDLDSEYEQKGKGTGRQGSANADNGSASSSDYESDDSRANTVGESCSRIGLGLDYNFPVITSPRVVVDDSRAWSDPCVDPTPRSSVISSGSSVSQYSSGSDGQGTPFHSSMVTDDQERRRAALMSIVSVLDQTSHGRATRCSDNSDYHGEQGFAYSGVGDINVQEFLERCSPQRTPSLNLPSSSLIPTFLVSSESTDPVSSNVEHGQRLRGHPFTLPCTVPEDSNEIVSHGHEEKRTMSKITAATARLTRRSLMMAAREREAFGLKPSDSELYHHQYENINHSCRDSHLSESSAGDANGLQDNDLSTGASSMIQSIQGKGHLYAQNQRIFDRGMEEQQLRIGINDRISTTIKASPPESTSCFVSPVEDAQSEIDIPEQLRITEASFVKILQTCIEYYALPLRVQGSRTWISGVPPQMSRFLDWLEDILHLHEQVLAILHDNQGNPIRQLLLFLPRFEVYQPYIAWLGQISDELRLLMENGSDFGYFVDLQDKANQDTGWTLQKYIFEPEIHLEKYLELFSVLLDLTARENPQHILVFSLLHSMELIVDVLHTVKREEENHRRTCALLERFRGPRSLTFLADRSRSVLWHGPLYLRRACSSDRAMGPNGRRDDSRAGRLSRAIIAWDAQQGAWQPSCGSSDSQESTAMYDSGSSYSGSHESSVLRSHPDWGLPGVGATRLTSDPLYAVIFSDLVLFGVLASGTSDCYDLLDDIGLVRIFSVGDFDDTSVFLEAIPIDSLDTTPAEGTPRLDQIFVSRLDQGIRAPSFDCDNQGWRTALRRSADFTKRLWCRPWRTTKSAGDDDTTCVLASLVGSGLPLPRSPSGCASQLRSQDDAKTQEREERGWWSLRFHQVMRRKRQMLLDEIN